MFFPFLQRADSNGDGLLSSEEYYKILRDHGIDCSHDEIMQIMNVSIKIEDFFSYLSLTVMLATKY